jgi:hypothetical protein
VVEQGPNKAMQLTPSALSRCLFWMLVWAFGATDCCRSASLCGRLECVARPSRQAGKAYLLVQRRAHSPARLDSLPASINKPLFGWSTSGLRGLSRFRLQQQAAGKWQGARLRPAGPVKSGCPAWYDRNQGRHSLSGAAAVPFGFAEQCNAVDAFGPEPVRVSDAPVGLGATDC